jgi:hypothetical protein
VRPRPSQVNKKPKLSQAKLKGYENNSDSFKSKTYGMDVGSTNVRSVILSHITRD